MKTTKSITLALAAICALGASALADQPGQKEKLSEKKTKTWDSEPQPLRTVGYPVVFLERAGHSVIRSPQIVSDTFNGKRDLVSKRGLMTERDMKKGTPKVSSAPKQSVANTRG